MAMKKPYWLGVTLTSALIVSIALGSLLVPVAILVSQSRRPAYASSVLILDGPHRGEVRIVPTR